MINKSHLFLLLLFCSINIANAQEHQWTRFRGTNCSGIDATAKGRTTWDSTDYKWNIVLPGTGNATPVVWEDKIFVTSSDDERDLGYLFAIDERVGTVLWKRDFTVSDLKMHVDNSLHLPFLQPKLYLRFFQ